jgi:hypothetical protein
MRFILFLLLIISFNDNLLSQNNRSKANDSVLRVTKDSLTGNILPNKKKHIARIATERSAIIPGWGQAYNREYWKIPIVYLALGIPAYTFFYNNTYYKKTKFAYEAQYKKSINSSDTADIANIDSKLKNLDLYSLQSYRNAFRRDRDFSIMWFVILWGVNVVDATVFGHLKDFDVSSDLSMHIEPTFNSASRTPGVSMAFNFKTPKHVLSSIRQ